jgi:DNA-binding protein WhiA
LWDTLSEDLREVATLRLDHPDASLSELCLLYENGTLSRSGINHRLRKIVETAKEL